MKKNLLSMFALAIMLLATGCSQDEELVSSASENVKASFTLDLGQVAPSRAIGDGLTATQLYYGAFDQAGIPIPRSHGKTELKGRTATVEFQLVKGQTYDFVFWAQHPDNKHYTIDPTNLTNINVNYSQAANDETRDAFLGTLLDKKIDGHFTQTVYLYRPFAQLNVGTEQSDYTLATELLSSDAVTQSSLVVSKAYTKLNTLTGEISEPEENVAFVLSDRPEDFLDVDINRDGNIANEEKYNYLSLNYILAKEEESELFDVTIQLNNANGVVNSFDVPSVPLQRNYRTNILGKLLTTTGDFNVVVVPDFLTPDYVVTLWDGVSTTPVTANSEGVYEIYEASELAWIAKQVNEEGKTFEGAVVRLMADINLNNHNWTPIGLGERKTAFLGTFDGNGFTIFNLKVEQRAKSRASEELATYEAAGLFGLLKGNVKNLTIDGASIDWLSVPNTYDATTNGIAVLAGSTYGSTNITIDNVDIKNAVVKGNRMVAGLVGYLQGTTIVNCDVENLILTATPDQLYTKVYSNGDKVGGIVAVANKTDGIEKIDKNSATNVTIKGVRDMGGIAGSAINLTSVVTNNKVKNITITVDHSIISVEEAKINAGNVIGRKDDNETVDASNTEETDLIVSTITAPVQEGFVKVDDTTWEITNMEGLFEFAKSVNEGNQTYSGATVKLTADIALAKTPWTPIGLNADNKNKFSGTFDGQGHTITGLYVETEAGYTAAGFFGALNGTAKNFTIDGATIKHISTGDPTDNGIAVVAGSIYNKGTIEGVTVKNAVVEGNRFVGGISGYTYGNVKNCVVENITLTATPDEQTSEKYNNGDKVGGIAGYFASENTCQISGNKVLNAKITGYRDMGGIVGAGNAETVKNNSVNVATLTVDQKTYFYEEKDANAGAIVGRLVSGSVDASNTYADVTINLGGGTSTDGEGNYFVAASDNADFSAVNDVLNGLKDGETLYLDGDVESENAPASNAYGKTGINMLNGGTVDGNGNTLSVPGATGTWDSALNTTGGTIKNLKIDEGFRGIFINHNSKNCSKVILENVIIDGPVYTISCDQGTNSGLDATDCTFNGWTSYAATIGDVKFTNCNFGEGAGYAFCRPYAPTEFVGCNFEAGYEMDPRAAVTFENCKINGVALTADNLATLVTSNIANATVK